MNQHCHIVIHSRHPGHQLRVALLSLLALCSGQTVLSLNTCDAQDAEDNRKSAAMVMELSIRRPESTRRGYRRPYVAAWLADKEGFPVKTILLWVQADGPGPRWIPDLRQWYRDDRLRRLVDDRDLVDAVSSPTRNVGSYRVSWDGTDDQGKALSSGVYTLLVESAREHGSYQIIREKLELSNEKFTRTITGNQEIGDLKITFHGLTLDYDRLP